MKTIHKVGIIGSGKMGSDIFNYLSDFNYELVWYTRNSDHKDVLKNMYQKKIKRQLKHGIINKDIYDFRFKYRIIDDINNLSECDLIIESIIEEHDVKFEIFKRLEEITKPSCVLASNSSSILPSELSNDNQAKNRIVGMHFFYPIPFKNVVELIFSEFTDEIIKEKSKLFFDDIKRFYIVQNERNAFILNRFLLQIQIVALNSLKKYGLGFKQLDEIAKEFIPEFGLFEMMDHVGHNTMYNAIMNYSKMDSDKRKYEPILNKLKAQKTISDDQSGILFYDRDASDDIKEISNEVKQDILDSIKETATKYIKTYSEEFQVDLYDLKKSLNEFCGLII